MPNQLLALLMAALSHRFLPPSFSASSATTSTGQVRCIQTQPSLAFRAQSRQESGSGMQRLTSAIPAKTPEASPSTWTVTEATRSAF